MYKIIVESPNTVKIKPIIYKINYNHLLNNIYLIINFVCFVYNVLSKKG